MTWVVLGDTPWGRALAKRLPAARVVGPKAKRAAADALAGTERVVVAVDGGGLEAALAANARHFEGHHRLLVRAGRCTHAGRLPTEAVEALSCVRQVAVVAGAADAGALAADEPAALVVGSAFPAWAKEIQQALAGPALRVYTQPDPVGVEVSAAMAEVGAVALGAARGLGAGPVAEATALTRAVAEMERLVVGLGGRPGTAHGLAGLGVLAASALRADGDPYRAGLALARGEAAGDGLLETASALAARAAEAGLESPMLSMVCAMLARKVDAASALDHLMARAPRAE
jgi:glycerol-3-phosphate dehydrogenase (NAD(P)+)